MKDVAHHLKYVQKKVLQFTRKSEGSAYIIPNEQKDVLKATPKRKRRLFNQLPRLMRLPQSP